MALNLQKLCRINN